MPSSQKGQENGHSSAPVLGFLRAPGPTGAVPAALLQARAQGGAGAGKDSGCFLPSPQTRSLPKSHALGALPDMFLLQTPPRPRRGPGLHFHVVVSTAGQAHLQGLWPSAAAGLPQAPGNPVGGPSCPVTATWGHGHLGTQPWEALASWAPECCGNQGLSRREGTRPQNPPGPLAAAPFSFPKSSHRSPRTEPERAQSLQIYYFTFSANKSRCKEGLFHINILTGFVLFFVK